MRLILVVLLAFFLFVHRLHAETLPPKILDPLVVSASHIPATSDTTSASTTIITRKEIEMRQAVSVVDVLRQVPGLHIDQPGGRGGVSSVYIRGSDPNFTVVMIDGVKVNDPTNNRGGSFDVSTLDPESIERIEIVRGALSSVHGSDAMGGVIHIITRSGAADPTTTVTVGGGTVKDFRAGLQTRGPLGEANYALNLSHTDDGSPLEGSGFTGTNIGGKLNLALSNTTWLELSSRYGNSERAAFPDDSGGPEFAVLREVDQRESEEFHTGIVLGQEIHTTWKYTIKVAYYDRQETTVSPGVSPGIRDPFGIPPNRSNNWFDRTNLAINTIFSPLSSVRMSLGTEAQFENGASDGALFFGRSPVPTSFDLQRDIYSAFLETEWETPLGLVLEGGARLDDPESFDSEVSPRAGLIYRIASTSTTLKANWGQGFKLPSFFALGHALVGNPTLQAETSRSIALGIVQNLTAKRMTVHTSYFNNHFFNLIDLDEGPPPVLVNRSEVRGEGVEMALAFEATERLWIDAHLSHTETDIKGSTEELRNRPEWRGGINTRWHAEAAMKFNLNVLYVGETLDSSIATGDRRLEDYLRVDIAVQWMIRPRWALSFAIDNLFDTDYEEAVGFFAPGIRGRAGLLFTI